MDDSTSYESLTSIQIKKPNLFLVERIDEINLLPFFCTNRGISNYQIMSIRGKNNLDNFLNALTLSSAFHTIRSISIICDADTNSNNTFSLVQKALRDASLPIPISPVCPTIGNPTIRVFICPYNSSPGTLETMCFPSITNDPAIPCIDNFFNCIRSSGLPYPKYEDKARIQSYLASREEHTKFIGSAVSHGYVNLNHTCFRQISLFLEKVTI